MFVGHESGIEREKHRQREGRGREIETQQRDNATAKHLPISHADYAIPFNLFEHSKFPRNSERQRQRENTSKKEYKKKRNWNDWQAAGNEWIFKSKLCTLNKFLRLVIIQLKFTSSDAALFFSSSTFLAIILFSWPQVLKMLLPDKRAPQCADARG